MFDAEKLLGKVLSEVTGSYPIKQKKYKKYKKDKYKQHHHSDDLLSNLVGKLMTGKGLMTAIGLGVGAYTILKDTQASARQPQNHQQAGSPPSSSYSSAPPPPPPPPGRPAPSQPAEKTVDSPATVEDRSPQPSRNQAGQELALRLIQVMIAAAHADGTLDEDEEKEILGRLRTTEMSNEEKGFLLTQFHEPKSIEELTSGINDPRICQAMYSVAVSSIVIDTEAERQWMDQFAVSLGLSREMQAFLEE